MDRIMTFCLKNIRSAGVQIFTERSYKKRFYEIGKLEEPKVHEKYPSGQLFIHKVFSYRGIVLYPLTARVYDRNAKPDILGWLRTLINQKLFINRNGDDEVEPFIYDGEKVRGKLQLFYHVLIDIRDVPFVRSDTNRITFIRHENRPKRLVPFPGMDYVSHDEMIPYTSTEVEFIQHVLFDTFFIYKGDQSPSIITKDTVRKFQEKFYYWIKLSEVHKEMTKHVRVTVIPFYIGIHKSTMNWWRYILRVENMGENSLQLIEIYLHIITPTQVVEEVKEVSLKRPLTPEEPASQFNMQVCIEEPNGYVMGVLRMERQDGSTFHCKIPTFELNSKPK